MTDKPISYEQIESAYKAPAEVLAKLPPSGLRERAEQLLDQSYQYAKEIREKVKTAPTDEGTDASVSMASSPDAARFNLVGVRGSAIWTTCFASNYLHLHTEGSCNVSS
jgi:hypothetical protein